MGITGRGPEDLHSELVEGPLSTHGRPRRSAMIPTQFRQKQLAH
jgi:hypothetical protein